MSNILLVFIFMVGLLIGSFLNVIILRLPINESIIFPASNCPKCKNRLKVLDLFPIFSYIFLGGRCRFCKKSISIQYPLIEFLNSMLYVLLLIKFEITYEFFLYSSLISILIVISIIDYKYYIIPDSLNLSILVLAVLFILIRILDKGFSTELILEHIMGCIFAMIFFFLIAFLGAMGGGDIKLIAVLGLFFGYKNIIFIILISFIIGGIISIILLFLNLKSKKDKIQFGPFISFATILVIFFEGHILYVFFT